MESVKQPVRWQHWCSYYFDWRCALPTTTLTALNAAGISLMSLFWWSCFVHCPFYGWIGTFEHPKPSLNLFVLSDGHFIRYGLDYMDGIYLAKWMLLVACTAYTLCLALGISSCACLCGWSMVTHDSLCNSCCLSFGKYHQEEIMDHVNHWNCTF